MLIAGHLLVFALQAAHLHSIHLPTTPTSNFGQKAVATLSPHIAQEGVVRERAPAPRLQIEIEDMRPTSGVHCKCMRLAFEQDIPVSAGSSLRRLQHSCATQVSEDKRTPPAQRQRREGGLGDSVASGVVVYGVLVPLYPCDRISSGHIPHWTQTLFGKSQQQMFVVRVQDGQVGEGDNRAGRTRTRFSLPSHTNSTQLAFDDLIFSLGSDPPRRTKRK